MLANRVAATVAVSKLLFIGCAAWRATLWLQGIEHRASKEREMNVAPVAAAAAIKDKSFST